MRRFGELLIRNVRTLSGVTRRPGLRIQPEVERRVTLDRAVWTKPLAFAADAVSSAMAFRSCGPLRTGDAWRAHAAISTARGREASVVAACASGDIRR